MQTSRGRCGDQDCIETRHEGVIAVVDGGGNLLCSVGDANAMVHLRSTAKPFQLLPFLLDGLHKKTWNNTQTIEAADLALLMASHSGEPMHTHRLERLLKMTRLSSDALLCGVHAPYDEKTRRALIESGMSPTPLHNNCSGKHLAMLMICEQRGWPLHNYTDGTHPLQQWIRDLLLLVADASPGHLGMGIDGCSLPTFILPMFNLARAFAQLAFPSQKLLDNDDLVQALHALFKAGVAHPEMIAGSKRLDTALMKALPGQLFAKTGAEGVFAVAAAPCQKYPQGLGIAIKVADGDQSQRVRSQVVIEVLRQLELLPLQEEQLHPDIRHWASRAIKNWRGVTVGLVQPLFDLR